MIKTWFWQEIYGGEAMGVCSRQELESKWISHRTPDTDNTSLTMGNIIPWHHCTGKSLAEGLDRQVGKLANLPLV